MTDKLNIERSSNPTQVQGRINITPFVAHVVGWLSFQTDEEIELIRKFIVREQNKRRDKLMSTESPTVSNQWEGLDLSLPPQKLTMEEKYDNPGLNNGEEFRRY